MSSGRCFCFEKKKFNVYYVFLYIEVNQLVNGLKLSLDHYQTFLKIVEILFLCLQDIL